MKELKQLRTSNEKHFMLENGLMKAYLYDKDVHYLKDGEYLDIDNKIITEKDGFVNKSNSFKAHFSSSYNDDRLLKLEKDQYNLSVSLNSLKEIDYSNRISERISNISDNKINYENIIEDIDIDYQVFNDRIKESIILKDKEKIPETIVFNIDTNLVLELNENKTISAKDKEKIVYIIDAPFMMDANNNYNYDINYELIKDKDSYKLILNLDQEWLNMEETVFPVVIDPTLIVFETSKYQDIYIYEGDTGVNRNNDKLIVGKDANNRIHRSLVKFDLPSIGTGDQIVDAQAIFHSHVNDYEREENDVYHVLAIHNINIDWNETTANWNLMNDKFDERIESLIAPKRNTFPGMGINETAQNSINITNLVRKWYSGTPNYGFMIKGFYETYMNDAIDGWDTDYVYTPEYTFYSKNYTVTTVNPRPFFTITYRNQNGLESYMSYDEQNYCNGKSYINRFNGNLTTVFNVGQTLSKNLSASLNIIYNTNDVIKDNFFNNSKDYGYGIGYKLNLHQLLKQVTLDEIDYMAYLDEDGTIHYFAEVDEELIDLDGLGLALEKNSNDYIMRDNSGNKMIFIKSSDVWNLKEIIDTKENKITINYDSNNRINNVIDADDNEINLSYESNRIIVQDRFKTTINYIDNKIDNIRNKFGYIYFTYQNDLLHEIEDINGKKTKFDYFSGIPYKIKKVEDFSIDNEVGDYLEYTYGFDTTTIKDNKGFYNTYTFNVNGNPIGMTNLNGEENIKEGYGKTQHFISDNIKAVNSLGNDRSLIKYVKNYIENSSFEDINYYYDFFNINNQGIILSDEYARTGKYSIKFTESDEAEIEVPKNNDYTFSMFIKNDNEITLSLGYDNEFSSINIPENEEFTRYDISIFYPTEAISNLKVKIIMSTPGIAYIDDIQLEEGVVANYHNLIDNSDFENGFDTWNYEDNSIALSKYPEINDEIIDLIDGQKALKINSNPYKTKSYSKNFALSGNKGDTYYLSFWYKNKGVSVSFGDEPSEYFGVHTLVSFWGEEDNHTTKTLDPNNTEWQLFEEIITAKNDYDSFSIGIANVLNANEVYITDFMLMKDLGNNTFDYDEKGNLISLGAKNNEKIEFKYDKNNQLLGIINSNESDFKFEYDNEVLDRVLRGISPTGISSEIKYDEFDNAVKMIIKNVSFDKETINQVCQIRSKGTDKYLKYNPKHKYIELKENNCSHDKFIFEKSNASYYIKSINNLEKYIKINNSIIVFDEEQINATLFELKELDNGSYSIKEFETDNYLSILNDKLSIKIIEESINEEDESIIFENMNEIQFYLENTDNKEYIETRSVYGKDGKTLIETIDALGNTTKYDIDPISYMTKSVTDAKDNTIYYNYDSKERLISIDNEESNSINYTYNELNLLTHIETGKKDYKFEYDNYLKNKKTKLNTYTLITNNYENNNGNLLSSIYGNNDEISFNYDDMDRLKQTIKMNNTYTNYYNNFGLLSRVKSDNESYNYEYDFAKRLIKYRYTENDNDFNINYKYNNINSVDNKKYKLNNKKEEVIYSYNNEDVIDKISFDDINLNYSYDKLGRLKAQNIDNNNEVEYNYIRKGKKTSLLVKDYTINNDKYSYKYDELNNITKVYLNNELINSYEYDSLNQLIKEDNYITNKTIEYEISQGNILSKKEFEINTENIIKEDKYYYDDQCWEDTLTRFNNENISYDNIGNPLSIGNMTLNWINGRQLDQVIKNNNNYQYKYNKDSIRTEKDIDGIKTNYYLEGTKIIFEQKENNMLYYIRDDAGNLIGFKYNDVQYYYIKNHQDDIIGILDDNFNQIASYSYDSWGQIESILDNQGNDVSNNPLHIANINPFRYRSYYYDTETELYYLNARYYNPKWGRFINADAIVLNQSLLGLNLYTYGLNNPINFLDNNGNLSIFKNIAKKIVSVVSKITTAVVNVAKNFINGLVDGYVKAANPAITTTKKSITASSNIGPLKTTTTTTFGYIDNQNTFQKAVNEDSKKTVLGKFLKIAAMNSESKYGVWNDNFGFFKKDEFSILTGTGYGGLVGENSLDGIGIGGNLSVADASGVFVIRLFGIDFEIGLGLNLLTLEGDVGIGKTPNGKFGLNNRIQAAPYAFDLVLNITKNK